MSRQGANKLPRNVQAQLDAAQTLEDALHATQTDEPQMAPVEPPVEPPVATLPPVEPVVAVKEDEDYRVWKQRYLSLQGQFNVTVPRLQQEVRDKDAKIDELIANVEQLEARVSAKPNADVASGVTEQDLTLYGPEMVEMVQRAAGAKITEMVGGYETIIDTLQRQVRDLSSQLSSVNSSVAETAQDRFYQRLDKLVPNWQQVNTDNNFLVWLGQTDPVYGEPRQVALDKAVSEANADRVAMIFDTWINISGQAPVVAESRQLSRSLEEHVAPVATQAGGTVQPVKARVFSGKEIAAFYDDVRRGRYTPEQAQLLENEINDAISSGRITN